MRTPVRTATTSVAAAAARSVAAAAVALSFVLAGCTVSSDSSPTASDPPPARSASSSTAAESTTPFAMNHPSGSAASSTSSSGAVQRAFATMSEAQRVGQLLMVDCPTSGISNATATAITDAHAGSVILDGTTHAGLTAIATLTAQLRKIAPKSAALLVSTDQEGGEVQRLQGSGFASIPSGVEQGQLSPATLQADARTWGQQLHQAGVSLNLAPVLDTVPAGGGPNPPIGDLDREYGSTPAAVTAHGLAFIRGMAAAGVDATAKHFPGLGRVSGNTDTAAGVTDDVTTSTDAYLAPYAAAVRAGVPFVMMSTAIYAKIDPGRPAAFSRTIVTGLLRDRLGFSGVIISDDLGVAKQVASYSPGQRAVDFVAAGGDVVLTVDASEAGEMADALLAQTRRSASFRSQLNAAVLRVLTAKQQLGLL